MYWRELINVNTVGGVQTLIHILKMISSAVHTITHPYTATHVHSSYTEHTGLINISQIYIYIYIRIHWKPTLPMASVYSYFASSLSVMLISSCMINLSAILDSLDLEDDPIHCVHEFGITLTFKMTHFTSVFLKRPWNFSFHDSFLWTRGKCQNITLLFLGFMLSDSYHWIILIIIFTYFGQLHLELILLSQSLFGAMFEYTLRTSLYQSDTQSCTSLYQSDT